MKSAFSIVLAVAVPWSLTAAIKNVRITGTTNTQAVLEYAAPDGNACLLSVSLNPTYSPVIFDLDTTKFAGANLDSRPGNLFNGRIRKFVVGKRSADLAADSNRYSRALQAYTTYYYQLTCPSTGDTASGQFRTANIPMGLTYIEPPPTDPAIPGDYAWPTLSWNDRTQQIVDPYTGALIRRMSLPNDRAYTQYAQNQPMNLARSTAWTNPNNALGNDTSSATVSGNSGKLFLSTENNGNYEGYFNQFHASHTSNANQLDYYQVVVNAATSNAACNTSATANCFINVCLTLDGANCYPNSKTFQQPLTTTLTNYTFGTAGTPIDLWQNAGIRPPNGTELAVRGGGVNCNGTTSITWAWGDYFNTLWNSGSDMIINGTDYQIASVTGISTATLQQTCPSGQWGFASSNFGVLIWTPTGSSDTVSVQYAYSNYQLGIFPYWDDSGEYNMCSTATVVGPTGNPGYNCSQTQQGGVYWIDSITGEAHLIALDEGFYNSPTAECGSFDTEPFNAGDPDIWYCGGSQPQVVQYYGNHSEPLDVMYPGHLEEGTNMPICNSNTPPTNQPCLSFNSLTGSQQISSLATAFDSTFQADRFLNFYLAGVENGILIFRVWRGGYGSIGWTFMFDPNATSNGQPGNAGCVGNGLPGCIVGAIPSWNRPNARWCAQKSNDFFGVVGWTAVGPYPWSYLTDTTPGVGPYISTVNDGTAFSTAIGVPGGLNACPPNPFGVTGNLCTTVNVNGEPADPSPCTASAAACGGAIESGAPGAIGNSAPGDYFGVGSELIMLLVKNGNSWTFERGIGPGYYKNSTSANPQLSTSCNSVSIPTMQTDQGFSGEFYWNFAADPHGYNLSGTTILTDEYSTNSHFYAGGGQYVNGYTFSSACPSAGYGYACYQIRTYSGVTDMVVNPPKVFVQENPFFAGKYSQAGGDNVQQHPAGSGTAADSNTHQYYWDGRPFNGTVMSGSPNFNGSNPASLVAGQLWHFPSANVPNLDRKFMPTFAMSGSRTLRDISAPNSSIATGASSAFTYCVAVAAGECYAGSAAGDLYVNAPYVNLPFCNEGGQATQVSDQYDICVGNNALVFNGAMQIGLFQTDNSGKFERNLTQGLTINRMLSPFYHVQALANGNWIVLDSNYAGNVMDSLLLVQVPPPSTPTSLVRGTFNPFKVEVKPPASLNVSTAYFEFGYEEYGAPANLFCTSRAETCAVGSATSPDQINLTTPFFFEQTESASLQKTPCASGCTISVPAVSSHVLYGRIVYCNAAGAIVGKGEPFAVPIP